MATKKPTKKEIKSIVKRYAKINPHATGLTLGILSVLASLLLVIGGAFLDFNDTASSSAIPLDSSGGIILFLISSFIQGAIVGFVMAWLYNKFSQI